MPMKVCFLVNPASGGRLGEKLTGPLESLKTDPGIEITVVRLGPGLDLAGVFQSGGYDRVIVVGGDGSFSSLLPFSTGSELSVGILPIGTGNDLAKELGVYRRLRSGDILSAVEPLFHAPVREIYIWALEYGEQFGERKLFANYLSFGFDAAVIRDFERLRQSAPPSPSPVGTLRNRAFYLRAALPQKGFTLPPGTGARAHESPEEIRLPPGAMNLLFANIRSYLGMAYSNSAGSPYDDRIEMIIQRSLADYLACLLRKRTGLPRGDCLSAREWLIRFPEEGIPVQADGEALAALPGCLFRIVPAGSVRVLTGS